MSPKSAAIGHAGGRCDAEPLTPDELRGRPVLDAAVRNPKVSWQPTTVAEIRELFEDDHVHAALIVASDGRLLSVIERPDLDLDPAPVARSEAWRIGRLDGRTVPPDADLEDTWRAMLSGGRRRLAMVGDGDVLLGLLCLKRTGLGFCSEDDVRARQVPDLTRDTLT